MKCQITGFYATLDEWRFDRGGRTGGRTEPGRAATDRYQIKVQAFSNLFVPCRLNGTSYLRILQPIDKLQNF
jgi:hypothetical protein